MTFQTETPANVTNDNCPLCEKPRTFSMMGPQAVVYCSDPDCSDHTLFEVPTNYLQTITDHKTLAWRKSYRRI